MIIMRVILWVVIIFYVLVIMEEKTRDSLQLKASILTAAQDIPLDNISSKRYLRLGKNKQRLTSSPTIATPTQNPSTKSNYLLSPTSKTRKPTNAPRTRKPTTRRPTSNPTKRPTKSPTSSPTIPKPNILIILADDVGFADVAFNNNPTVKTPSLDKIAKESVQLSNFHMSATCSPGRAGMLTGRYPARSGVWHTIMGRSILAKNELILPNMLKPYGYVSGLIGKWHLGDNYPYRPLDRGFDYWYGFYGGGFGQTPDIWGNGNFDPTFTRNQVNATKVAGFCTDILFDDAISFLKKVKEPFLLLISPNAAHAPQDAPSQYTSLYNGPYASFYGMISNLDYNIGRLDKTLNDLGMKENTIFIFTSDNGSACGSNRCQFNAGLSGDKSSIYDGGHRVPFLFRYPKRLTIEPKIIGNLLAHIDVVPTLLDIAGIDYPTVSTYPEIKDDYLQEPSTSSDGDDGEVIDGFNITDVKTPKSPFDGKSFRKLLETGKDEAFEGRILVLDDQRVYLPVKYSQTVIMCDDWRYIPPKLFFDMKTDRAQATNIYSANQDLVKKMSKFYEGWWTDVSKTFGVVNRIMVGDANANPVYLNSMDWNIKTTPPWEQEMVIEEQGSKIGGWSLDVVSQGSYEITGRRWPFDLEKKAINYANQFTHAQLLVNQAVIQTNALNDYQSSITFKTVLQSGVNNIMVIFFDGKGSKLSAYYLSINKQL